MHVLITGGAGYIGSHTALCLLERGHTVLVMDNLANSSRESLGRVSDLTGKDVDFRLLDLLDEEGLQELFAESQFDAVIHFAGLKAAGQSVEAPLTYYQNNVTGTINLIRSMDAVGLRRLVFSSSAAVYGGSGAVPLTEDAPLGPANPYGRSKKHLEDIFTDLNAADDRWRIALLRYFNPAGAHRSGTMGEDPRGVPNNLVPYVAQVAVGRREKVTIFGRDYPTPDGTGVRDYIHVLDLAEGHLAALDYIAQQAGVFRWNLGTGTGSSVLDVVRAFSQVTGSPIPYEFAPRRAGDVAISLADPAAALADLGWSARRTLMEMCEDHWRWQSANPLGYDSSGDGGTPLTKKFLGRA